MTPILDDSDTMAKRLCQAETCLATVRDLWAAGPGGPRALPPSVRDELAARLRIAVLFPHLDETKRCLMLALALQHRTLAKLVNRRRVELSPTIRVQWETVTDSVEQRYMQILSDVKAVLHFPELPCLEQQLFEHEFHSIPLPEERRP